MGIVSVELKAGSVLNAMADRIEETPFWFWALAAVLAALLLDRVAVMNLTELGHNRREEAKALAVLIGALFLHAAKAHAPVVRLMRLTSAGLTRQRTARRARRARQKALHDYLVNPSLEAAILVIAYDQLEALRTGDKTRDIDLYRRLFMDEKQAPIRTIRVLHKDGLLWQHPDDLGYMLGEGISSTIDRLQESDVRVADNIQLLRGLWRQHGYSLITILLPDGMCTREEHLKRIETAGNLRAPIDRRISNGGEKSI